MGAAAVEAPERQGAADRTVQSIHEAAFNVDQYIAPAAREVVAETRAVCTRACAHVSFVAWSSTKARKAPHTSLKAHRCCDSTSDVMVSSSSGERPVFCIESEARQ